MRAYILWILALSTAASTAFAEPVALRTSELDTITGGQSFAIVHTAAEADGGRIAFAGTGASASATQTRNLNAAAAAGFAAANGETNNADAQVTTGGNTFFERSFSHNSNTYYSSFGVAAGVAIGN